MAILARWNVELNWIYLIIRLKKSWYNWAFYSAFFYNLKVTVESFDFSAAARALSIVARRFDKVVLTAEWGSQYSVLSFRYQKRRFSPFWICGIPSPDGHAISLLWTAKDSRQIIDWVFLGSYTTLASSKIVYNRVGSSRLERALAHNFMVSYTYVARNISIAWTFHQYSFHTKKVNECSTLICLLKYPTHEATLGIKLTKGSRVILDFITYLRDPIAVTPSWILLLQLFLDLSATASTYSKLLMDVFYLSVS